MWPFKRHEKYDWGTDCYGNDMNFWIDSPYYPGLLHMCRMNELSQMVCREALQKIEIAESRRSLGLPSHSPRGGW